MKAKWSTGQRGKSQPLQCGVLLLHRCEGRSNRQSCVTPGAFCAAEACSRADNTEQPVAATDNTEQHLCNAALHKTHRTLSQTKGNYFVQPRKGNNGNFPVNLNSGPMFSQTGNVQMAKQFDNLTVSPIGLFISSQLSKYAVDEFHVYVYSKYFQYADVTST